VVIVLVFGADEFESEIRLIDLKITMIFGCLTHSEMIFGNDDELLLMDAA
jgi:hypothetical protein